MKKYTNEWEEYDLTADASLDKYALDEEIEKQSALMLKWLTLLTKAQHVLAKRKEELANIEAELLLFAKTNKIQALGDKPTDVLCKAWVKTQPAYKKAVRKKLKAETDVTHLQHARTILEHKKAMLKIEADLWICGYYAKPTIRGKKSAMDDTSDMVRSALKKKHLRHK